MIKYLLFVFVNVLDGNLGCHVTELLTRVRCVRARANGPLNQDRFDHSRYISPCLQIAQLSTFQ